MAQHLALTEGRTVVVTGAASGIRLAAAKSTRSNYLGDVACRHCRSPVKGITTLVPCNWRTRRQHSRRR
jgi:hypothetical protein